MMHKHISFLCRMVLCTIAAGPASAGETPANEPLALAGEIAPGESRRERGQYLVNGILHCFQCHSELDVSQPGHPPKAGRAGVGGMLSDQGDNRLAAPNLTSDPETGIGQFSDAELARAIRQGIGRNGRRLRAMPSSSFSALSDEDLAAVIAYLRSLEPVLNRLPPTLPAGKADPEAAQRPLLSVASRDLTDPVERGRYLVELADCVGCHTAWAAPRMPGALGGGNEMNRAPGIWSSNITADPTGIGYGADGFVQVIKTGKAGTLHPVMPWTAFRNISEQDLRAIYSVLVTTLPVRHIVNNTAAPSFCAVCEQTHGGGEHNTVTLPEATAEPAEDVLDAYVGVYHSAQYDISITVARDGSGLGGQAGPSVFPLVAQTNEFFLTPGFYAPIRFERNGDAPAHRLFTIDIIEIPFDRVADPSTP